MLVLDKTDSNPGQQVPKPRNLAKKFNFAARVIRKILHIPEKVPQFVQIATTNKCNLTCKMCMRFYMDMDVIFEHMDIKNFKTMVDKMKGVKQIALSGLGETMTHPSFFEAVKYCKSRGLNVQLTSNGTMLGVNNNIEKLIESGIDSMTFSIESIDDNYEMGHGNKTVLDNIKKLIDTRNAMGSKTPEICMQPILFSDKIEDVFDVIKWSSENGANRVNVTRVDLRFVPNMKRPDENEEKQIFKRFAKARKKYGIRIDYLQDQVFDGIAGFLYKHFKKILRFDSWCYRFQDFVYINVNGDVYPCCMDEAQKVGNLLEDDLVTIWTNKKYNHIRSHMDEYKFCEKCDYLRLKQVV